jgi:hypothetical protein
MTLKTIILFVILFLALRFILKFLLPIIAVTRHTQKSIKDLKAQMESMQQPRESDTAAHSTNNINKKVTEQIDGEYIEFEEVK